MILCTVVPVRAKGRAFPESCVLLGLARLPSSPFNVEGCAAHVFARRLFRFCVRAKPYNAAEGEVGIFLRYEDVDNHISALRDSLI